MADEIVISIAANSSGAKAGIDSVAQSTRSLQDALSGAGASGLEAGSEISEGMQKAEYSMMEARHAAMMTGEEIGIRIPRALAGVAARSETLGPLLASAFSGIALIAFAELLVKATEKFEKWIEDTFIFTEAMRVLDTLNKVINSDIEDQDKKLKGLKESYEEIGLKGSELSAKKFEFFNADQLAPAEQKLQEVNSAVGYIRGGFDDLGQAVTIANAKINEFNASMPKDKQVKMLPDTATEEQALEALMAIQGDYQKRVAALEQEGANRQKEYEAEAAKEAEEVAKKRLEIEDKINMAILKSHAELEKELEKGAEEQSRMMDERLKSQLEYEEKSAEAVEKSADAQLKLNAAQAKAAAEAQADVVARDKALGLTHQQVADEQKLVVLLEQQKQAELAIIDAKMAEAQAAMQVAQHSGPGGGQNVPDYNNALAAYQEYQAQRVQIAADADKKIAASTSQELKAEQKDYQSYLTNFNTTFANAFAQIEMGHETMGKAAQKVYQQMAESFLKNMAITMLAEIEGAMLHKTLNAQKQLSDAKGAASGAYNALAGIPIIGPIIAPIAAATAFAAVMAFDEGGMVPMTQMALVHSGEAVLTPQQTENFREMTENGPGGDTHNYGDTHIHAMDSKSFESFLKRNPGALSAGITHAAKNGHLNPVALAKGK